MPRLAALLIALLLPLAACNDDGGDDPTLTQETTAPASLPSGTKPRVTLPKPPAPKDLVVTDLVVGAGAEAKTGDSVTVHYVGVHFTSGRQFDASWDGAGKPFEFVLGQGRVIQGWDRGIAGMKVGGRRQLVIPPNLAYGDQGYGDIGPNETLVFVVDLLAVS